MAECCIVINSCCQYYAKTVPILLETLKTAGVPDDHIYVVVGESDTDRSELIDGIKYIFRRYCNIDNNGLLWITQERPELQSEWIFYMHDTCYVHQEFWTKCCTIVKEVKPDTKCTMLQNNYSMGIGFYNLKWLYTDDVVTFMASKINYDPNNKSKIKWDGDTEDTLFKYAKRTNQAWASLHNTCRTVENDKNIYGTCTKRIIEYWEIPGLYKVKANFGVGNMHTNL